MSITPTSDPLDLFRAWFDAAKEREPADPNAVALATVAADGRPSLRMVLLKGADARGFVFYTNYESRKGQELLATRHAALCFHWKSLKRQVRIEGPAAPVEAEEADAYFASRDRGSQLGAWASLQSRPMGGKMELMGRVAKFTAQFGIGGVPRPPHWSGFRIRHERLEFWQDGRFRLHDRLIYAREGAGWKTEVLYP
ncbi:MAG: pyridoxamine 5'-phosphate oxidase [Candidatus Odyssella sp.]|nr:pyridoxamine 5'-phosphate oxidase [Candidatus Odyssella sp.]